MAVLWFGPSLWVFLLLSVHEIDLQRSDIFLSPKERSSKSFCVREASLRQASIFRILKNGSCHFYTTVTTALSATSPLPIYKRLSPAFSVLLMRTGVKGDDDPAELLFKGPTNQCQETVSPSHEVRSFKSPLFEVWGESLAALSRINVQLFTAEEVPPIVDLEFRVEKTDILREGKWFSKQRLLSSKPWKKEHLTSTNFHLFSINGDKYKKFAILTKNSVCTESEGYMFLVQNWRVCQKYEKTNDSWIYFTVKEDRSAKFAKRNIKKANELRILGFVERNSDDIYYVRIM